MQYGRTMAWMALVLILILALAGCAPRVGAGETAAGSAPDALVVDLPSIALDVADDGGVSFGGIDIAELAGSFGVPLSLPITADQVAQLKGLGIQHLQVANQPDGLAIFVNGQEIPSLGWNAEQLATTGEMFGTMPALGKLLPVLTQLGVGVTLRLPVAEGVEPIPLQADADGSAATRLAEQQQSFVAGAGSTPTINIPVSYNMDGTWSVAGLSGPEWIAATGQSIWSELDLTPEWVQTITDAGIRTFNVSVTPDGLGVVVNDVNLPSLDWSGGKLASVIDIVARSGMLEQFGLSPEMLQTLLDTFLPMLTSSNVSITALFPAE